MIARIQKMENGYSATFKRNLKHPIEEVWSYLTDNEKLPKWFSELRVDELRKGGVIKFDMGDGTFDDLSILDLKINSILEFTWWEDTVRFELTKKSNGCFLRLIEKIN